jgi:RNA polymerase sigma-70 factor (ECF subfamily)
MAQGLSKALGKTMNAAAVRQSLHRARERFADLLLDQVLHSLQEPSMELLHQELIDLKLYQYCEPALARHQQENPSDGS